MTEEEKYQEIVKNREVASGVDKDQSGVKTDPPANEKPGTEEKPKETQQPTGDDKGKGNANPTDTEKEDHAFAKMRMKFKRENDALRKEIDALKKAYAEKFPREQPKTRKDFETDEEYGQYVRKSMKEEITSELRGELESSRETERERENFTTQIRDQLERTFNKEISDRVVKDLFDPESELSMIITDERANAIAEVVKSSSRRADLLALMQAKPQMFQKMLELPPEKQKFRMWQLEDEIESRYAQLQARQQAEQQKKERADSLPTAGTFGVNGNGATDISGLSPQQRVERYKSEMRKNGII